MTSPLTRSALPAATEVLIVGAGPTGLTLSASLSLLGVDHVLVDRNEAVRPGTKAAGVQPRSLEYLARIGVADTLIAEGLRGGGFAARDKDRTLVRLSYDTLDTPYPFLLLIGQQTVEEHLENRVRDLGGDIHRRHELLSWREDFPGVTATLVAPDGTLRAVHARYLVGCDGVHSRVREDSGITFLGDAADELFALADVRFGEPPTDSDTTFFFSADGLLLFSPLPGDQHRIVASVSPGSPPPSAEQLEGLLRERAALPLKISQVVTASTYHVQQRVAERFSRGPVFLCGDAAHTHSPAGGQGMNTGIQDAANLAWKLCEVIAGDADPALLDSYHRERRPVAAGVVAFTTQVTGLVTLTEPGAAQLRNDVVAAAGTVPGVSEWVARRLSQLDVAYPGHGPVGRRLPWSALGEDGLAWTLGVPDPSVCPDRIGRLAVRSAPGLDTTALIRPDGYAAAVGVPADPSVVLAHLGEYAMAGAA